MRTFSIYVITFSLCLILVLNPVTGYWLTASRGFAFFYMVIFDIIIIIISLLAFFYLRNKRKSLFYCLLGGLFMAVPTLIAAEAAYLQLRFSKLSLDHGGEILEPDQLLGFKLRPNAIERHWSSDYDAVYRTGADGYRPIEQDQVVERTIHIFGDSFTFGYGVDNGETWPDFLRDHFDKRFNVFNYAVIGYGLDQMYLSFRQNADRIKEGDIVLFAPISDDLQRNLIAKTHPCLVYLTEPGGDHRYPKYENGAWRTVSLANECDYLKDSLLGNAFWPISLGGFYRSWRLHSINEELMAHADHLFRDVQNLADQKGAVFQTIFLATPEECEWGQHGVDLADLKTPAYFLLDDCPDGSEASRRLRFAHDRHYSVDGHRWAADAIYRWLAIDGWPHQPILH